MSPIGRRVRLDLAYDGTDYRGWQMQIGVPTVQGAVEEGLSRILGGAAVRLRAAGRTDSGVHAQGQVADAWIETRLSDDALARGLAGVLPRDIRPIRVRTVDPAFDAQRSAVAKTYAYELDLSPHGDPLSRRTALTWPHRLEREAVRSALLRIRGRHDFSGFADSACTVLDRTRSMFDADWEEGGERGRFRFRADGFLTHMVRNLVGTCLEIGRGRFEADRVDRIFQSGDRSLCGPTAPARGLCLVRVDYEVEPDERPEADANIPPPRRESTESPT